MVYRSKQTGSRCLCAEIIMSIRIRCKRASLFIYGLLGRNGGFIWTCVRMQNKSCDIDWIQNFRMSRAIFCRSCQHQLRHVSDIDLTIQTEVALQKTRPEVLSLKKKKSGTVSPNTIYVTASNTVFSKCITSLVFCLFSAVNVLSLSTKKWTWTREKETVWKGMSAKSAVITV